MVAGLVVASALLLGLWIEYRKCAHEQRMLQAAYRHAIAKLHAAREEAGALANQNLDGKEVALELESILDEAIFQLNAEPVRIPLEPDNTSGGGFSRIPIHTEQLFLAWNLSRILGTWWPLLWTSSCSVSEVWARRAGLE